MSECLQKMRSARGSEEQDTDVEDDRQAEDEMVVGSKSVERLEVPDELAIAGVDGVLIAQTVTCFDESGAPAVTGHCHYRVTARTGARDATSEPAFNTLLAESTLDGSWPSEI